MDSRLQNLCVRAAPKYWERLQEGGAVPSSPWWKPVFFVAVSKELLEGSWSDSGAGRGSKRVGILFPSQG